MAFAREVPVTRIANLTPVGPISMPVYVAITPMAKHRTAHLGQGSTHAAARLGAVMEAIERFCAEQLPSTARTCECSYAELLRDGEPVCRPEPFELPLDTRFAPNLAIQWVLGRDLLGGEQLWIPRDLVVCPPVDGVLHEPDSNGLAAGNSLLEAVVHGLCEVIERDAVSQLQFVQMFADPNDARVPVRTIAKRSLPDELQRWIEAIEHEQLEVLIQDITNDIGVACVRVSVLDDARARGYWGAAAHVDSRAAVRQALGEAVQARVADLQYELELERPALGVDDPFAQAELSRRHGGDWQIALADVVSAEHADLREDLAYLLDRLRRAGFERCMVVDLSRPGSSLAVVRVRVPGLSQFCVNRRRVGLRCHRHLA